jgi:hypothetical protein
MEENEGNISLEYDLNNGAPISASNNEVLPCPAFPISGMIVVIEKGL